MYFICAKNRKILLMRAFVTSKNVKWCHLIWPTLYDCENFGGFFVVA